MKGLINAIRELLETPESERLPKLEKLAIATGKDSEFYGHHADICSEFNELGSCSHLPEMVEARAEENDDGKN